MFSRNKDIKELKDEVFGYEKEGFFSPIQVPGLKTQIRAEINRRRALETRLEKLEKYLDIQWVPEEKNEETFPAHYVEGRNCFPHSWSSDARNALTASEVIAVSGNGGGDESKSKPEEYWSPKHELFGCRNCGRSNGRHQGRGLCSQCYYKKVAKKNK